MAIASYRSSEMSRIAPVRISTETGIANAAVGRMTPIRLSYRPSLAISSRTRHDHRLRRDRQAQQEQPEGRARRAGRGCARSRTPAGRTAPGRCRTTATVTITVLHSRWPKPLVKDGVVVVAGWMRRAASAGCRSGPCPGAGERGRQHHVQRDQDDGQPDQRARPASGLARLVQCRRRRGGARSAVEGSVGLRGTRQRVV